MNTPMETKVREFLRLFHHKDIDFARIAGFLSADARYQAHVPGVEPLVGRDTIRAGNEDMVCAERRDYVTQNGKRVEVRVNAIFEFNPQGEICSWREYWDMGAVQQQLGISAGEMSGYMEQAG